MGERLAVYLPPPPYVWFCTPPSRATGALPVRGANLIGFGTSEYVGPDARVAQSLASFAALGGNWVAVNFWWFQDSPTSVEITPDPGLYTISDEAIAAAVHAAHDRGLKVMLRPMVDLRDGSWRRFIRPSPEWFEQYLGFISWYASRAAEWDVEAYSVGAELALTEHWESNWRRVIEAVRTAYAGTLVYCATYDTVPHLPWWDAVDVIGIDAYYAVSAWPGANVHSMTCAWSHWLDLIERQIVASHPDKPIWFTELGVRSARAAARLPWCYNGPCFGLVHGGWADPIEQANHYRAALLASGSRPWLHGVFWWAWYADPNAAYIGDTDYSPQGKRAEDVLAEFWATRG